ncbi:Armadillo repeat-containing protein [Trichinella spiralis]|uniref:Armadillo repeat-containing protein n=1 Tax=Trichinella spiralis TaxID=6334 RepID=A0ABR3KW39_TRISP
MVILFSTQSVYSRVRVKFLHSFAECKKKPSSIRLKIFNFPTLQKTRNRRPYRRRISNCAYLSICLTSFTTHCTHFQKIKWKELVTVRIRRINFLPTAAQVFCLFEPEPPLTSAPMRIENWTDAQWMFRL